MKDNKTIFNYLMETMTIFGYAIVFITLIALGAGDNAKNVSSIFQLGSQGIPATIILQFFVASFILAAIRNFFFSDAIIKKMAIWMRTLCMMLLDLVVISAFIIMFAWFPVNQVQYWALFLACFGFSFVCSLILVVLKEKITNKKMEQALRTYQTTDNSYKYLDE